MVLQLISAMWLNVAGAMAVIQPAQVFFECQTVEGAEQVAHMLGTLDIGVTALPNDCYWVRGEKQADIIELIKPVETDLGVAWVGVVKRAGGVERYSAGFLELKLS